MCLSSPWALGPATFLQRRGAVSGLGGRGVNELCDLLERWKGGGPRTRGRTRHETRGENRTRDLSWGRGRPLGVLTDGQGA